MGRAMDIQCGQHRPHPSCPLLREQSGHWSPDSSMAVLQGRDTEAGSSCVPERRQGWPSLEQGVMAWLWKGMCTCGFPAPG